MSNLSNLVANKQVNAKQPLKRVLESTSPGSGVDLKRTKNPKKNQENLGVASGKNDPTRTIESKIKNIAISDENDKVSTAKTKNLVKAVKSNSISKVLTRKTSALNNKWKDIYEAPALLPANVADFDKSQLNNIDSEPLYAFDIFQYHLQKEQLMRTEKYMAKQKELSDKMRTVLVDWLVEVQQTFELNHETLYLAVKYIDHFLMRSTISRTRFQLLGLTAVFIACKLDVSFLLL